VGKGREHKRRQSNAGAVAEDTYREAGGRLMSGTNYRAEALSSYDAFNLQD